METLCSQCSAPLTCTPERGCWCAGLPPLLPVPNGNAAGCLCRACLIKQIEAVERGPATLPPDCYPDSRNRLPLVQRDELSDAGKEVYDDVIGDARSFVGLLGPGGIRLRAPRLAQLMRPVNMYLRFDAGLDQRLAEIAILATARENDQHYEWNQHERLALKAGLEPEIIDVIRHRLPLAGLAEREATLITLAREAIGEHAVHPETFATALRLFGEEQLVLFVSLMGHYGAIAYLLTVFNNQLAEGEESTLPRR